MLTRTAVYTSDDEESTNPVFLLYIALLERRLGANFVDHFIPVGSNTPLPMGEYEATSYVTAASRHYVTRYFDPAWSALMKETYFTAVIVDPALVRLKGNFNRNTLVTAIPICGDTGGETLWTPKPDFHISYGDIPIRYATLLGESESRGETPGAATVKMALMSLHALRVSQMYGAGANHIVLSVYISIKVCTMHIFYKDPNDGEKSYMQCILREDKMFGDASANVRFLRMLFNFVDNTQPSGRPAGPDYVKLSAVVQRLGSKRQKKRSEGQRKQHRSQGSGAGDRIEEEPSGQDPPAPDRAQLAAAGYAIIPEPSLHSYRHILRLHSKGRHLVAKWTTDNEERRLLKSLQSVKTKTYRNTVILVEEFLGSWIIMPYLTDLSELGGLSLHGCLSLYSQLVEGVTFLHEQGVVHMDLKPSNLVFQYPIEPHGLLSIIDFNLAAFYKDGDRPFSGFRGTEGWTAPEVQDGVKYNPRCAEIWAIGSITHYFFVISGLEDTHKLSSRLMADTPSERPTAATLFSEILASQPDSSKHESVVRAEMII